MKIHGIFPKLVIDDIVDSCKHNLTFISLRINNFFPIFESRLVIIEARAEATSRINLFSHYEMPKYLKNHNPCEDFIKLCECHSSPNMINAQKRRRRSRRSTIHKIELQQNKKLVVRLWWIWRWMEETKLKYIRFLGARPLWIIVILWWRWLGWRSWRCKHGNNGGS